jgi:RNA polymerase sigma-70 factor (ECF subfamily)
LESSVVARAREGSHDAFAVLAAARIDDLYRIARMILRDPELAEDAVQDTLLAAWRGLPGLRDLDRFDAWLRRLLVRACTRGNRRRRGIGLAEVEFGGMDRASPDDAEQAFVLRDLLERGLERLGATERALLVLHYYLDLPVAEIAELLGMPAGTVKSRVHRASQRMRASLDADDRLGAVGAGAAR